MNIPLRSYWSSLTEQERQVAMSHSLYGVASRMALARAGSDWSFRHATRDAYATLYRGDYGAAREAHLRDVAVMAQSEQDRRSDFLPAYTVEMFSAAQDAVDSEQQS